MNKNNESNEKIFFCCICKLLLDPEHVDDESNQCENCDNYICEKCDEKESNSYGLFLCEDCCIEYDKQKRIKKRIKKQINFNFQN